MVESRINRQASARPNRGVVRRFRVVGLPPRRQWPRQAPARRFCGAMSAAMGSLLPTHAHVLPSCRRRPLYCKSPLAAQPVPAPPIQPTSLPGLHRATQRVCRYTRAYQGLAGTHEGLTKGLLAHTKGLPRACRHTRRAYQGLARYPWRYTQRGSPNAEGLPFILSGQVCAGGPDSAADGAPCLMKISINPYAHPHRGHLALGHATPHAEPTLAAFISKPAMPPLLQKNCAARLHQLIASPNETVLSIWCRSLLDAACHFFAALPKPSRVVSTSRRSILSPAHVTRLPA